MARAYTVDERLTLDVTASATAAGRAVLGAQRDHRREGCAGADAGAPGRHRRAAAVPVRLRRRGVRDPDRVDRVRVLRRRPGGLARGRGAAAGADQRARAVQPAAGHRADLDDRGRPSSRTPRWRCSAATGGGSSTCRRARRVTVRRGALPVRVVRLRPRTFTDRLVAKFGLPVHGWRGGSPLTCASAALDTSSDRHRPRLLSVAVLEELRITGLGVIEDTTLPLAPGMNVITGETGAGKTMVVTGLGLLFGGRADAGRVRAEPGRAVVEGRLRLTGRPRPGARPGGRGRRRARRGRHAAAEPYGDRRGAVPGAPRRAQRAGVDAGRGRRAGGGRARPVRPAAAAAAGRAARRAGPVRRRRSTRSCSTRYRETYARWRRVVDDLADRRRNARERAPGGRPAAAGAGRDHPGRSAAG